MSSRPSALAPAGPTNSPFSVQQAASALGIAFIEAGFQLGQQGKDGLPLGDASRRRGFSAASAMSGVTITATRAEKGGKSTNQTLHVKGSMNEDSSQTRVKGLTGTAGRLGPGSDFLT